jgi:UDP-3-O-[3-hydroxymyristoyl] N-acetylglucosamine deacetylase
VVDNPDVLIIEDEASIGRTLSQVLQDEGISAVVSLTGEEGLAQLDNFTPRLVILDIWLPGIDGIELLKRVKVSYPALPVIMISGHANVATAIEATRSGAYDFLEKPLELTSLLLIIKRVLCGEPSPYVKNVRSETLRVTPHLCTGVFADGFKDDGLLHRNFGQRTLARTALLYGQGLHTGRKSGLRLEPLPLNSGIHFTGIGTKVSVPAHHSSVDDTGFATRLKGEGYQVSTVEHLLSALRAYKISNLLIHCNEEVPILDGSSVQFCRIIEESGIEEQGGVWAPIVITERILVEGKNEWIAIEPSDVFEIDYTLEYGPPLGKQLLSFTMESAEYYREVIAPARTFGLVEDIGSLQQAGLAQGGRFDNFVLVGPDGPINGKLRFSDEFVRHKILDCIGDLSLLGRPICGKVTAYRTGHSDNLHLMRQIVKTLS